MADRDRAGRDSAGGDAGGWLAERVERRRERIRAEIERNRRGDHKVPTWVLAAVLVVIVVGWVALVLTA